MSQCKAISSHQVLFTEETTICVWSMTLKFCFQGHARSKVMVSNYRSLLYKFPYVSNTNHALIFNHLEDISHIEYKIGLFVFKCLHALAPAYLSDLVCEYVPTRSLRSTGQGLLQVPRTRLSTFGDCAFASFAPRLWNDLPVDIRSCGSLEMFKSAYKTYLFRKCFSM